MAGKIAPETRWLAKMLYCLDRLSFAQTAQQAGVSVSAVRSWAEKHGWMQEREAFAATEAEIYANMVKARALALRKLLDWEGDKETSLALSAVDKLERLALAASRTKRIREKAVSAKQPAARAREDAQAEDMALPEGITDDERLALLEEGVNRQIAHVLRNPVADMSEKVRQIKAGLEVVASLKGRDTKPAIQVSFDE